MKSNNILLENVSDYEVINLPRLTHKFTATQLKYQENLETCFVGNKLVIDGVGEMAQ